LKANIGIQRYASYLSDPDSGAFGAIIAMPKIVSPWKSFALGILCVGIYAVLQFSLSAFISELPTWINQSLVFCLLLSPLAFIPFVERMSSILVASIGSASTILIIISISTLFQDEFSSTDWRGVAMLIGVLMGVSIFFACPIVYCRNRKHIASEQSDPAAP